MFEARVSSKNKSKKFKKLNHYCFYDLCNIIRNVYFISTNQSCTRFFINNFIDWNQYNTIFWFWVYSKRNLLCRWMIRIFTIKKMIIIIIKYADHRSSIFYRDFVNILSRSCRHFIEISSTFYRDFIDILSRFCWHSIEISLIF